MSRDQLSRREMLKITAAATLAASPCWPVFGFAENQEKSMAQVAEYVHSRMNWSAVELNEFLNELPPSGLLSMKKALEIVESDTDRKQPCWVERATLKRFKNRCCGFQAIS